MAVGGAIVDSKQRSGVAAQEAPDLPRVTWYKHKGLIKLYLLLVIVLSSSATTGYDGSMMNSLQSVTYWQNYFGNPEGAPLGLLNAIYPVGSMCAMPIFPVIADRFGRRWGIIVGAIVILIAVALQAASQNLAMFTAARFLIGLGVQIGQGCAPLLLTELAHPQHRARFTALYNTTWFVGNIIATWITFGTASNLQSTWCWRLPSLLQGVFAALQIVGIWFVPESPRWYVQKNRPDRALRILAHYYAFDDTNDITVQFVQREIETTLALEKEFSKYSIFEFFKTKGNRHRLLILVTLGFFSQWSGNAIISYYLTKVLDQVGITDQKEQLEINGGLGIWGWIVAVTCSLLIDKVGRRKMFLTSTFSMMIVYAAMTVCAARYAITLNPAAGNAVIGMLVLYNLAYSIAWSGLLVAYAVEIVPFALRAKGLAIMFFCVNAALFFNNYVNPIALAALGWKYYLVYVSWLLVELVIVYVFYPETRGPTLEEMAKIFDGDEAAVGRVDLDIVREKHGIVLEERENAGPQIV